MATSAGHSKSVGRETNTEINSSPISSWKSLQFSAFPAVLAPLAGVSDAPFRTVCQLLGAELTYVEMLSATALLYDSKRTFDMLSRHADETKVGVQITGKTAAEVGQAVAIIDRYPFETIDINMGCPVQKVVRSGCGSAILREPERVFETVKLAREATAKPLSVKIRLGWDTTQRTYLEVLDAAQSAGAEWITVHGRLRCDDYATPVDLPRMADLKDRAKIPVIGNGNIFSAEDAATMQKATGVDGIMVSRGALGQPWIFRELKGHLTPPTVEEWWQVVRMHLDMQQNLYGDTNYSAVCMRKHLLWYLKGWPQGKKVREQITQTESLQGAMRLVEDFANDLIKQGVSNRIRLDQDQKQGQRFVWDPKFEMDRKLDRGVGDDQLA